jgi:predicted transcriptional regulator
VTPPVEPSRRKRPLTTFTLSPEARAAVEALAESWGVSKSAVVEQIIRQAARDEGLDLKALGRKERRRLDRRSRTS